MAQQAPLVFAYPLIEPITYFELCRELVNHDSVVPELEAPSVKQDLLLRKRDEPRQKEEKFGGVGVEVSEKRLFEGGDTQERDVL